MKHWGSAFFPLSILLALTLLTFWLRYASELPEIGRDGKSRHDPDYIVTDSHLRKLDQTGQLKFELTAPDIRHYPDNDSTDIFKPKLVHHYINKPPVTLTSERGHISKDGEQVDFYENVLINRPASAKEEELNVKTTELSVRPDDETAFTKSPVHITKGNSWVKGIGMQIDNRAQTYSIQSQSVAFLESRRNLKKKP